MKMTRLITVLLGLSASAHAAITLDWVTVGDPGNAADSTGYGAVAYEYQIMKYEVTNAQYAAFLNAADASGAKPNGIYNGSMASDARGGITFNSGAAAGSKYAVKSGYENMPVVYVSHLDAQRFANWVHNGQPADGTGTETGAYTVGALAVHNPEALYWIPTENEWYKAAYYQPQADGGPSDSYWLYPTRSDTQPTSATAPSALANAANYLYDDGTANGINGGYAATQSTSLSGAQNYLSNVGAYSNSSSYYGTFDQGGNVWEWNDAVSGSERGLRGGSWGNLSLGMQSSVRDSNSPTNQTSASVLGFRLATSAVPEPSRILLLLAGMCAIHMPRRRLPSAL